MTDERGRSKHGREDDPLPEDDGPVDPFLAKLRAAAQEEVSEGARLPADFARALSPAEHDEIASAALAALAGQGQSPVAASRSAARPAADRVAVRGFKRYWPAIFVPLAAAAAFVLVLRPGQNISPESLPPYELTASDGLKQRRGPAPSQAAGTPVRRIARQTELVLVARPTTVVEGELGARVFLVRGTFAEELTARTEIAPTGSVQVRVRPADEARIPLGLATLKLAVGRPAAVRSADLEAAAAETGRDPRVRWLSLPVELVER